MAHRIGHDKSELVTPEAGQPGLAREQGAEPFAQLDQHRITAGVAIHIIDLLEVIQIDHAIGNRLAALGRGGAQRFGRLDHAAPVEALGQRVGGGEQAGLILGAAALGNFTGEFAVTPPAEDDEGNIEQQRADQHPVGRGAVAQQRAHGAGQNCSAGCHQQEHRSHGNAQREDVALGGLKRIIWFVIFQNRQPSEILARAWLHHCYPSILQAIAGAAKDRVNQRKMRPPT